MGDENVYPTEYMNTLANTRQTQWETDSSEGVKKIRDALADENSFGDVPALASYGKVFAAVREVYLETMRGAKTDLDEVARGIKSSAKQMKDNDDAAGEAFVSLWGRWEQGPLEATRSHEQATSSAGAQEAAQTVESADVGTGTTETDTPIWDAGSEESTQEDEGAAPAAPPAEDDDPDTSQYDASAGQPESPIP